MKMDCGKLSILILLFFCNHEVVGTLRIASFNVQIFGIKKVNTQDVLRTLVEVVKRYDIILIQEVRDSSDTALELLVDAVNRETSNVIYSHVTSDRLGRSNSKEQYSFIYRTGSVSVVDRYQYSDPSDVFQREPFCVQFRSAKIALSSFVLMAIHTDPDTAIAEMDALVTVHEAVSRHWQTDNILIMGDLNADCAYASQRALKTLSLRRDPPFTWLIQDNVDTTTTNTNCAYDRFIVSGPSFKEAIVPNSAKVFRFDSAFDLTASEALKVSDHYPIELELTRSSARSFQEHGEI